VVPATAESAAEAAATIHSASMPAYSATSVAPYSCEDDDSFSDSTACEGVGRLTAVSRMVMGSELRRVPLRKFGLAMVFLAAASAGCALASGFLPAMEVVSGQASAATDLSEQKRSNDTDRHDKKKAVDNSGTCGKVFSQCGGHAWAGSTCCQKGCVCIRDSKYFSMCTAPGGLNECNIEKAGFMAAKLRKKAAPLRKRADKKAAIYKKRKARADKLAASFIKTRDLAIHALHKAQASKAELDKRNTTYTAAAGKMKQVGWEKDQAVMWWGLVDNANNANCGDWNGACQASKCCQHGCGCIVKNAYWSQCGPLEGQTSCSVDIAKNSATKHAMQATGSQNKTSAEDARKASEAADAEAAKDKEAFEKAENTHDQAHKVFMKLHAARVEAEKLRDESHEAAEKAKHAADKASKKISKAQVAAEIWATAVSLEVFK